MKKLNIITTGINKTVFFCLLIPIFVFAENTPTPDNTPTGFADKSGPAPPPPTPINEELTWLILACILFAFIVLQWRDRADSK